MQPFWIELQLQKTVVEVYLELDSCNTTFKLPAIMYKGKQLIFRILRHIDLLRNPIYNGFPKIEFKRPFTAVVQADGGHILDVSCFMKNAVSCRALNSAWLSPSISCVRLFVQAACMIFRHLTGFLSKHGRISKGALERSSSTRNVSITYN